MYPFVKIDYFKKYEVGKSDPGIVNSIYEITVQQTGR